MNAVRSDQLFNKQRSISGILGNGTGNGAINPRPANFRLRNEGGFGDRWMRNSNTASKAPAIKANLVSEKVHQNFNIARSRVALSSSGSSSKHGVHSSGRSAGSISSATKSNTSKSPRTPGSATLSSTSNESKCIVAITEGRGKARGEVGIAAIDVYRPNLVVSQISDCQMYSKSLAKISILSPVEILLPNTFCDGTSNTKLFTCIKEQFPNITLTTVQRRHFSDVRGLELIKNLCVPEYSSVEVIVQNRFYALSAAAALIKYVEFLQNLIFAPKSLCIKYEGSQNTVLIDIETAKRLELVSSAKIDTALKHSSLLGTLNHTLTVGGFRLLRATLLQPPCVLKEIETRQQCVEEVVSNPILFRAFQAVLPKFADSERLLTLSMMSPATGERCERTVESQLNFVLLLKSCLEYLGILKDALSTAQHPYFKHIRNMLQAEAFDTIQESLKQLLHDDAKSVKGYSASCIQRCFAIKSEMHVLLDLARKTYCELVDEITHLVQEYSEEYGLPLRVNHNTMKGFHIMMSVGGPNSRLKNTELPKVFIQVTKTRSSFSMTTQALINLDGRSKEMLKEIQSMSSIVLSGLLAEVRQQAGCLYQLCEAVSQIDLITSLAVVSSLPDYVKPSFGPNINVKAGKHPILTNICQIEPVPNDIEASEDKNFMIITGPNMAGKSIYIRQVALLQIMAQVGCYLPAESAELRVTDRIFSRIGFEDSIEGNASTFVVEMKEMNFILQQMTPSSLIIIDELCRGTSSEEGTSIAWALCERLLCSPAFTFFTTHFLYLTRLQNIYSNVSNYCLEAVEKPATGNVSNGDSEEKWIRYTHRLIPGVMKIERYGLRLAKLSLMPQEVTQEADKILGQLITARKPLPNMQIGGQSVMLYQTFRCLIKSIAEKYRDDPETAISKQQQLTRKFKEQHPNWQEEMMMSGTPLPTPRHLQTESARMNFVSPFLRSMQLSQSSASEITSDHQSNFRVPEPKSRTPTVTSVPAVRVTESQGNEVQTPRSTTTCMPLTPSTGFKTLRKSNSSSKCSTPFSPSQIPLPNFKTKRIEEYFVKMPRKLVFEDALKDVEMEEVAAPAPAIEDAPLQEVEEVMDTSEPTVDEPMHQDEDPVVEEVVLELDQVDLPDGDDVALPEVIQEQPHLASPPTEKQPSPVSIQEMLRQALPNLNFEGARSPVVHRRSTSTSYSFGAASFTIPTLNDFEDTLLMEPVPSVAEEINLSSDEVTILNKECFQSIEEIPKKKRTNRRFQMEPSPEFDCSMSFKDFLDQRSRMKNQQPEPRPSSFESPAMQNFYKDFTPSSQQIENAQQQLAQKLQRMRNRLGSTSPPLEKRKRLFRDGSRLSQNSATPVLDSDVPNYGLPNAMGGLMEAAPSSFTPRKSFWTHVTPEVAALPQETAKET